MYNRYLFADKMEVKKQNVNNLTSFIDIDIIIINESY